MNKLMEIKAKIDKYFEEHPNVKKGLKIAGSLALTGASLYAGYKLGAIAKEHRSNDIYVPSEPAAPAVTMKPEVDPKLLCVEDPSEFPQIPTRTDIPTVDNNEVFDMIFRNPKTGEVVGIEEGCYGQYVNDMMGSFEDTDLGVLKGYIPKISTVEDLNSIKDYVDDALKNTLENKGE